MIERVKRNAGPFFTATLVLADALLIGLAFYIAYRLRLAIKWPTEPEHIAPFREYAGMLVIQILSLLAVSFFSGLYHEQRARSFVDEMAAIAGAVSIGTLIACSMAHFSDSIPTAFPGRSLRRVTRYLQMRRYLHSRYVRMLDGTTEHR